MTIEFFGEADRNSKGEVTSEMPAWYFTKHMRDLKESLDRKNREIDRGDIPRQSVPIVAQEIKKIEKKIDELKAGCPKLIGGQKDKLAKAYHDLQNKIKESLPTRLENEKGVADPYKELDRMKNHHIQVDPELAKACNVSVTKDGKVNGDGANKMYKLFGRRLGENENVEKIRREGMTESQQMMHELTAHIIKDKITQG